MKRVVFGVILLAALLVLGFVSQSFMVNAHQNSAFLLERAGLEALDDNWDMAQLLYNRAKRNWDKEYHLSAALADHDPMEDVDSLYAQLGIFAQQQETTHFAALCMETAKRLQAMADAHVLSWWSVF